MLKSNNLEVEKLRKILDLFEKKNLKSKIRDTKLATLSAYHLSISINQLFFQQIWNRILLISIYRKIN